MVSAAIRERAILTLGAGQQGRGAMLIEDGRPPILGVLRAAGPQAAAERIVALLAPAAGLLVPGDDAHAAQREAQAADLLAELLGGAGMQEVQDRLAWLRGGAERGGGRLLLLLDARGQVLRGLPWELLEALPPESSVLAGCRVARIASGFRRPLTMERSHLELVCWAPDRQDAVTDGVLAELQRCVAGLERASLQLVRAGDDPEPPSPGVFRAVHVVAHGHERLQQVALQLGRGRSMAADNAFHGLRELFDSAGLAVLDVCSGGSGRHSSQSVPAWRFVEEGLPACIAPGVPMGVEASMSFNSALYRALAGGETLAGAVAAGRRALRAMGLDHPSCRWWNPVLVLGEAAASACTPALRRSPLPAHWPTGDPGAEALLRRALHLAQAQGFLGLEHLALCLSSWERPSPLLSLARPALPALCRDLPVFLPGVGDQPLPTPRLESLMGGLEPGFDLDALLRALVAQRWVAERLDRRVVSRLLLRSVKDRSTRPLGPGLPEQPGRAAGAGVSFEVLGGPDDGRLLRLARPGQELGRWDPSSEARETRLHLDDGPRDPHLSRRHLRYLGDAAVAVLAPSWRLLAGEPPTALEGQIVLRAGDTLLLGGGTRLVVRSVG